MLIDEIAPQSEPAIGTKRVWAGVSHLPRRVKADESVTDPWAERQVSCVAGNRKGSNRDHPRQLRSGFQVGLLQ